MKGSFIQKMYFPNSDESFIYENPEKPFTNPEAQLWSKLPKIIWFYWDAGLTDKSNVAAEIIIFV
jgi:hypothetical protein